MKFLKGLSWLIVLNILVKPVWIFFIDRQVQLTVGHEVYGKYFSAFNLSIVLIFIADAGISNMMNQRIAGKISVDVWQLLRLKISLLVLYTTIGLLIGWMTQLELKLILYILLIQSFTSLFIFLRSIITANQFFSTDAVLSVLDKSLVILLCSGFIYGLFQPINIYIFLQVQLISTVLSVIVAFAFINRKNLLEHGEQQNLRQVFFNVFPFALVILLMSLHYRLDGFLLERLHPEGAYQAGIYASTYRLLDAGNMLGYLTASFLVPFISRHYQNKILITSVSLHLRHALIMLAIVIVCICLVAAPSIQNLLYHTDDSNISLVLQFTMATLPAYYLVHIYGSILTATSQLKVFHSILITSVIINIIGNLCFIPIYGAIGCSIAALVSQYICSIALLIIVKRRLAIPFGIKSGLMYAASGVFLFFLFFLMNKYLSDIWLLVSTASILALTFIMIQLHYFRKNFLINA